MTQVLIAAAMVVVAVAIAAVLRRRQHPDPPSQPQWRVPAQLDRADFARPDAPWLVAVFSSASCKTCAAVVEKAGVLECPAVAVDEVEVSARRDTHNRYRVDAVPMTLVADAVGVVRASFLGPVTATDLWAAVAELRDPGCSPEPGLGHPEGEMI